MATKINAGNFFEDFSVGQELPHATPRTITTGDVALYTALFGGRYALQSADTVAQALGLPRSPVDDWLVFHIVFGKTVPDVSLNAVANLGYAQGRFLKPVYPGDTLSARSTVIGLKENSNGKTGTVYVNSVGTNQHGETVLDYCRWVMIRKRDANAPAPTPVVPALPDRVDPASLQAPAISLSGLDDTLDDMAFQEDQYSDDVNTLMDEIGDGASSSIAEEVTSRLPSLPSVGCVPLTFGQSRITKAAGREQRRQFQRVL